ncbi:MAG: 5'-methylthioadenosine/adenosylhomocysteine nucleosidase [Xanthomonadaceae bacterium]|nr:5'-methylthioadenosine/adenosylhomocysteine nucleosidase [Xanthomonadaceae bacterium]
MLAIMSAMSEEINDLVSELTNKKTVTFGMRDYHTGKLWGSEVVLVFSRWGKVAAAVTTTHLISHFKATEIIFTGVAGGVSPEMNIGDIVVGTGFYQHDMDARPIFKRHEIPLIGLTAFSSDGNVRDRLHEASKDFLDNEFKNVISESHRDEFSLSSPKSLLGEIASGDQFFASSEKLQDLRERLPKVLCVEMEGAAVAQVCHEYQVPFAVVRTISDSANEHASINYQKFLSKVASQYSKGILSEFLSRKT